MKVLISCLLIVFITGCVAPPVTEKKKDKKDKEVETNEIDQPVRELLMITFIYFIFHQMELIILACMCTTGFRCRVQKISAGSSESSRRG